MKLELNVTLTEPPKLKTITSINNLVKVTQKHFRSHLGPIMSLKHEIRHRIGQETNHSGFSENKNKKQFQVCLFTIWSPKKLNKIS